MLGFFLRVATRIAVRPRVEAWNIENPGVESGKRIIACYHLSLVGMISENSLVTGYYN
jgi:hypothetical protein